jgi:hypothetical protein
MTSAIRKTSFSRSAPATTSSRADSWSPRITRSTVIPPPSIGLALVRTILAKGCVPAAGGPRAAKRGPKPPFPGERGGRDRPAPPVPVQAALSWPAETLPLRLSRSIS